MSDYSVLGSRLARNTPQLLAALEQAHGHKDRPLCLCRPSGLPMYVAKIGDRFFLKRMPNSGDQHTAECDSYEPPPELSGLGQVMGSAIKENPEDGMTSLALDFSLTKYPGRAAPLASGVVHDTVATDGHKLSLRAMLHYLWEEAGFHQWSPAMAGKRTWYVIRKYLLDAANNKKAKAGELIDLLYIPEFFQLERKEELTKRRHARMSPLVASNNGARKLLVLVGQVKDIAPARYGQKIVFKHLADFPFMLADDLYTRVQKRFAFELEMWSSFEETHLMAIATFGVSSAGIAAIEEIALMNVTEQWIPFENSWEYDLIGEMTRQHRRFSKGLRYNMSTTRPLACLVATDTQPEPTAMYIAPPDCSDEYNALLDELTAQSKLQTWIWKAGVDAMPNLPSLTDPPIRTHPFPLT